MSYQIKDQRMKRAIEELKDIILDKYPEAAFRISEGEDSGSIHLHATVDLLETDPVIDLVMDKVLSFQEDDGLPVHVLPEPMLERLDELRELIKRTNPLRINPFL